MLLYRVPISVVADAKNDSKTITLIVSFYRRSVDASYQTMVARKVEEGELTDYIRMMLCLMLETGKYFWNYRLHF